MKKKPPSIVELAVAAIEDVKGLDIKVLDVRSLTAITDHMVVCSGTSNRHVRSIAENVVARAKEFGHVPRGVQGLSNSEWVLVDLVDVVVHVMQAQARLFYQLEKLWDVPAPETAKKPAVKTKRKVKTKGKAKAKAKGKAKGKAKDKPKAKPRATPVPPPEAPVAAAPESQELPAAVQEALLPPFHAAVSRIDGPDEEKSGAGADGKGKDTSADRAPSAQPFWRNPIVWSAVILAVALIAFALVAYSRRTRRILRS